MPETERTRNGIGGHHSASMRTDEWLTPPEIIKGLGPFDLDPCAPIAGRRPWPTATLHYTADINGLAQPWPMESFVWLNPPYGPPAVVTPWMQKMMQHGHGIALIFARTETDMFFRFVWDTAAGVLFIRSRLHFYSIGDDGKAERAKANAGAPSCLVAYGREAHNRLRDSHRLEAAGIRGEFVDLWK